MCALWCLSESGWRETGMSLVSQSYFEPRLIISDQLLDYLARGGNQRTRGKHFWGRVGKNTYGTSSLIVQGKHWRKAIALATALHSHKCLVSEQDSPSARFRGLFTSYVISDFVGSLFCLQYWVWPRFWLLCNCWGYQENQGIDKYCYS